MVHPHQPQRSFMNISLRILFIIIICIIGCAESSSAAEYLCRSVSLEHGLSQSSVTALSRDGRGYLWIGTRFGLNRYDRSRIRNYYHDPTDERSLHDNDIQALFTDSKGRLWVSTLTGLSRYNAADDKFDRIKSITYGPTFGCFYEESDGILIGGTGYLYFNDFATDSTTLLKIKGGSRHLYTAIHPRSPGFYVMATRWDGMWLFDRERSSISPIPYIPYKTISASVIDSRGILWLAPYGEGLRAYDRAGVEICRLTTANSDLRNDIVLDIEENDGRLWIATDGGGLCIYNMDTETFEDSPFHQKLRDLNAVTTLYSDPYDNLFVGTVRFGAASIRSVAIHCFNSDSNLKLTTVSTVTSDDNGRIWLGEDGGGVLEYDPNTEAIRRIKSTEGMKVTDITTHSRNELLVATFDKGFYLLDTRTEQLKPAPEVVQNVWKSQINGAVPMFARYLSKNMIALIGEKVTIYDPVKGIIPEMPERAVNNIPSGALEPIYCKNGRLLCKGNNFVSEYDPLTGTHVKIYEIDEYDRIYCTAFDGNRTLYLCTDRGVERYDISTGTLTMIPEITERPTALAIDGANRLWAATTHTLYLWNPENSNLMSYGISDGVVPNEYLSRSQMISDGRLFFGGGYGLLRVNIDELIDLSVGDEPMLSVADIRVDGRRAYSEIENGVLKVRDTHSLVSLEIMENGKIQSSRIFRYIIRGVGPERTIETTAPTLDLNFLEPGNDYHVLLSSKRSDGSWTNPQELVTLAVMAPWFRSPWFIISSVILLIAGLAAGERIRNRHRKAKLEKELENYRHVNIERELSFLLNTNYALRTPLTMIYAPLKLLIEKVRSGESSDLMPALEGMYRNTKKMRDTIDMALELHNVNGASVVSSPGTHDISRSIEEVRTELTADLAVKHLSCVYIASEEMFPAIYDRQRMGAVISVLLRNAIQRSPENSSIEIRAEKRDDFIRVSVSDAGAYLEPETLEALFSRYFNDDNSKFGNSLEFAYAKNLVEMKGGRVGAENNQTLAGITVWFEFPGAGAPAVEAYTRRRHNEGGGLELEQQPLVAAVDTSQLTAVVVEEDNDLCMFITAELKAHFGKVLYAFNGRDALMLIRQSQPDIVVTSLMLPIMSGLELCRTLKKSPQTNHIPIIVLTTLKEGSTIENAYGAGADSYLAKPFDINILLTRCRNLLHSRAVMRDRYTGQPTTESAKRAVTNADETFMLKINKIVEDHLADSDFSVDTIVEEMALSRSALYAKFKEITGMPIGAYIADCRFKKAKELLKNSNMTVNEISEILGFSSQRYFSTFFKERSGMTPSAYRTTS